MGTLYLEIGLLLSLVFNVALILKIEQQKKEIRKIKGGVQLSKEELERLKARLDRIKRL
ncbi:MAG: hypothetical protein GXO65_04905 [Euryarchaeota archaeon]|nr:hypothetical protein [Euryarchaeota archaeon]